LGVMGVSHATTAPQGPIEVEHTTGASLERLELEHLGSAPEELARADHSAQPELPEQRGSSKCPRANKEWSRSKGLG
jgi:hypothetical protein